VLNRDHVIQQICAVCPVAAFWTEPAYPQEQKSGAAWQTWEVSERYDPDKIADDLIDCRQRGLDWLDRKTSNQVPVRALALQQLATDYVAARRLVVGGRVAQIKVLLQDGIDELARQGHPIDAGLLRDLFFGDSTDGAIRPPGELLRIARERSGDSTESRFRERRANVIRSFAKFLIVFVDPASRGSDGPAGEHIPDEHGRLAITDYAGDNEHFIQLLADAINVTIVGVTNEGLATMLEEALNRKRAGGRADAFWGSLRIVFLGKEPLKVVNDGRESFQDSDEALRQRRQEAVLARRLLGVFLKRTQSTRWELFEYPYMPGLIGSLLDFGDKKIVHLLMIRPQRPAADRLYVDLEDVPDQYFSALFEDIIHASKSLNMIVPIGAPTSSFFRCTEFRDRSNVLKDGSGASGWLPLVLVITARRRGSHVEPILQLRSGYNSARELNRLSHLSGHIIKDDLDLPPGVTLRNVPKSFHLTDEIPMRAAQRLVQEVTGVDPAPPLQPLETGGYLYPDKEHLFFFIFALELPDGTQFPRWAEMHPFPLPELLVIRANQVLRSAARLCETTEVSERAWAAAAEVMALNLYLHDYADLSERMTGLSSGDERASTAAAIKELMAERTSPSWMFASREAQLMGLAGWQYREFFSVLLPSYDAIGIDDAAELSRHVLSDSRKVAAIARLRELYQDEHLMASVPFEL
jgi:hypothetical protein